MTAGEPAARCVVDASIAVKWLLSEIGSESARALLDGGAAMFAPDLLYAEVAHVLWKRQRRGEVTGPEAVAMIAELTEAAIVSVPCRALAGDAQRWAVRLGHSAYDCFYLALARQLAAPLATADAWLASLAGQAGVALQRM